MAKNPEAQGETKSAPQEIQKSARYTCGRCGLSAPAAMVPLDGNARVCRNAIACRKRQAKAEKARG